MYPAPEDGYSNSEPGLEVADRTSARKLDYLSMTHPLRLEPYDLLVIGGGINGAGIARDAAGRGLRVLLCERGDLAEATSSSSTKLLHGGLRGQRSS